MAPKRGQKINSEFREKLQVRLHFSAKNYGILFQRGTLGKGNLHCSSNWQEWSYFREDSDRQQRRNRMQDYSVKSQSRRTIFCWNSPLFLEFTMASLVSDRILACKIPYLLWVWLMVRGLSSRRIPKLFNLSRVEAES